MASVEEVEAVLDDLVARMGDVDESTRALLPASRTIEARCPDLGLVRYAEWRAGRVVMLEAPPPRPDIRISIHSDDLLDLASGDLAFARAYASSRIRLDASMTDLLRLRAVL